MSLVKPVEFYLLKLNVALESSRSHITVDCGLDILCVNLISLKKELTKNKLICFTFCFMLCYAVLCCVVSYRVVSCCVVSCRVLSCRVMSCCVVYCYV